METEIWKDIPWYIWYYQASSFWRIRNIKWKILKQQVHHQWYLKVSLCVMYDKKTIKSHRLIALAFVPNPFNKRCVCHKDNNKQNNFPDNLYWGTQSENMDQAVYDWILMWNFHTNNNPHKLMAWSKSWFAKKVNQFDENGNVVNTFWCIVDAENFTWVAKQSISAVCRWIRKSAWWFIWRFTP